MSLTKMGDGYIYLYSPSWRNESVMWTSAGQRISLICGYVENHTHNGPSLPWSSSFCCALTFSVWLTPWLERGKSTAEADFNLFSKDEDTLALSLWSIIVFYVTGSHLNQITTKGIKMSLSPANYRAWQNLRQKCGMNSLELIRIYHCHCHTCVGTLTLRSWAQSLSEVWKGPLWIFKDRFKPLGWESGKLPIPFVKRIT